MTQLSPDAEKRFSDKFKGLEHSKIGHNIKFFLVSELEQQREKIVREVEKTIPKRGKYGELMYVPSWHDKLYEMLEKDGLACSIPNCGDPGCAIVGVIEYVKNLEVKALDD